MSLSLDRCRVLPVRDHRAGMTLVEMMIALVIGSVVVGTLLQTLSSQGQFARFVGAREESQQNTRAGLELISSELRGTLPAGILNAERHALRFHLPRAWGVLCNTIIQGSGNQTAWVRFPAGFVPADFARNDHRWGIAVAQTADPNVRPQQSDWQPVTRVGNPGTASPCAANLGAAGAVQEMGFSAAGLVPAGSPAAQVPPGALVFLFEQVAYDVGPESPGDPVQWLRRSVNFSGSGTPQFEPMIGPLPAATSVVFEYFNGAGAELAPGTLSTQAARNGIANVRLSIASSSSASSAGVRQTASAATSVTLRNR